MGDKKFIIQTNDERPAYLIKSASRNSQYAWRRGKNGQLNAVQFDSREEAQVVTRKYGGAFGALAVVVEAG